jgi:hypothetical protein
VADHVIPLPGNFHYVYQFQAGKSQYRCVEACLAMAGQIAYPARFADPVALMSQIYTQYVGPDVPGDRNGTERMQAIDWLTKQHIGYIDMQHLIDAGQIDELHKQIQEQNLAGLPQLISIGDESYLHHAKTGLPLHNWADALNHGSHTMLRVGFSDNEGYGLYYEPAAAPNFAEPVPIAWQDFLDGKIVGCIAIFPHGMQEYPPKPKPVFDQAKAELTLQAALTALSAAQAGLANLAHDLEALKSEV